MLVGLIPFNNIGNDIKNPSGFHNLLLSPKFSVINRSVEECSLVGCDIVYIFCGAYIQKYIKRKYSAYMLNFLDVHDIIGNTKKFLSLVKDKEKMAEFFRTNRSKPKVIPIIFHKQSLPVELSCAIKSQVTTAIFGAYEIHSALSSLSSTMDNVRFYMSFPQTTYLLASKMGRDKVQYIRELSFRLRETNCYMKTGEKSIINGYPVPFTFDIPAMTAFRKSLATKASENFINKTFQYNNSDELYTFANGDSLEVDNLFFLNEWEQYVQYLHFTQQEGRVERSFNLFYHPSVNHSFLLTSSFDNAW